MIDGPGGSSNDQGTFMSDVPFTTPLRLDVEVQPVLLYAMAHNRISPITRVVLNPTTIDTLRDVWVDVTVAATGIALSTPWRRHVTEVGSVDVAFDNVQITLDPTAMAALDEQRPGVVTVTAGATGYEPVTTTHQVQVLAHNQWSRIKSWQLSAELLCSFVMPNHPAVTALLSDAADILLRDTGSSSLEGYQSGPERAHAIARATWQALAARRVRYSDPPASWDVRGDTGPGGQKIRTPSQVLDDRFATCLDLSVLYAAALEQAGLCPLLLVPDGHAFVGYWSTADMSIPGAFAEGSASIGNLVDLNYLTLVETTLACERERDATWQEATTSPVRRFMGVDSPPVRAIIDVAGARRAGISPLPARVTVTDSSTTIHTYEAAAAPARGPVNGAAVTRAAAASRSDEPPRIALWKSRLLDLSRGNKLVNFTTNVSGLDLRVPSSCVPDFEDLLHTGQDLTIFGSDEIPETNKAQGLRGIGDLPEDFVADELLSRHRLFAAQNAADTGRRTRTLISKARTIQQETGANTLYVVVGMLHWVPADGKEIISPLLLVPVRLKGGTRGRRTTLCLDDTNQTTPNYCLIERLRLDHGLQIPGLAEPAEDGRGLDTEACFLAVRTAIAQAGITGQVHERTALAVLDYLRFPLWRDMTDHWRSFVANPLVKHLIDAPDNSQFDDRSEVRREAMDLDALAAECPVPADSAQLEAVDAAVRGETFVLQGPPGTGKSQTITNLLARAMAEGRTVLFVAEKAAALDVVKRRIEDVALGPFTLDLHNRESKPSRIRSQLLAALDHDSTGDAPGHRVAAADLARRVTSLAGYARRLHEVGPAGLSAHQARDEVLALGDGPTIDVPQRLVLAREVTTLEGLRAAAASLPDHAQATRPDVNHPWAFVGGVTDRRGLASITDDALSAAVLAVDEALADITDSATTQALLPALREARLVDDLRTLTAVTAPGAPSLSVLDEVATDRWASASATALQLLAALTQDGGAAHGVSPNAWHMSVQDLAAAARLAADSGFLGRGKRLRELVPQLAPALVDGAALDHHHVLTSAEWLVRAREAAEACRDRIAHLPGVTLSDGWNPLDPASGPQLHAQVTWLRATAELVSGREGQFAGRLREALAAGTRAQGDGRPWHRLTGAVTGLLRLTATTDGEWRSWSAADPFVARWSASRARRARDLDRSPVEALRRWAAFVDAAQPFAAAGLTAAHRALLTGALPADLAGRALERGIAAAALQERLVTQGFDEFDPQQHERLIDSFVDQAPTVRGMQSTELPAQLTAARAFDPANPSGRVAGLRRELTRQRGGKSVRQLVAEYGELILKITPCVLVSPGSLARFFPPDAVRFDLVVFDEASQIRVADAVGAMGRGRSVVIVGDSQQMPPSTLMEASIADDDHELPDGVERVTEDLESILSECVESQVPRRWLTWHYRSQDESLIAFSNAAFYDGRLSSFPGPGRSRQGFGVSLRRVAGHFHRSGERLDGDGPLRTNAIEARAVVAEIETRFSGFPADRPPSIGVVTFNVQQRDLITELLENSEVPGVAEAVLTDGTAGLFVKNLENVQGDERDTIFFSTGFSPNAKGTLPLTFGPLNLTGGERRLNVAVTRARREVVVFSSFDPEQLRRATSRGITLLRAYLQLARDGVESSGDTTGQEKVTVDRHRSQIAAALRDRGWHVRTSVGLSDFTVDLALADPAHPDRSLLAILLDGPAWASRRTVGDRDGMPAEVLRTNMGWAGVARIWLPSWLIDSQAVLDSIDDTMARLIADTARPAAPVPVSAGPPPMAPPITPPALASTPPSAAPQRRRGPVDVVAFEGWAPGLLGTPADLENQWTRSKVASHVAECLAAEAPILAERLAKSVGTAYGMGRITLARAFDIVSMIPDGAMIDRNEVIWSADLDPATWAVVRTSDDPRSRPLDHVPLREIGNAMVHEAVQAAGSGEDELLRSALACFGGRRVTDNVRTRLLEALALAEHSQRLHRRGALWVAVTT